MLIRRTGPEPVDIVLTDDIEQFISTVYCKDVPHETRKAIRTATRHFIKEFISLMPPHVHVRVESCKNISAALLRAARHQNHPILSLDDKTITWADDYLYLTNKVDINGRAKWTNKPGTPPLREQIDALKRRVNRVLLVDVGAQSGQTIAKTIALLEKAEILVAHALVLISGESVLSGPLKRRVTALKHFKHLRWIELRDLLGLDGRILENKAGETIKVPTWGTFLRSGFFDTTLENTLIKLCLRHNQGVKHSLEKGGLNPNLLSSIRIQSP